MANFPVWLPNANTLNPSVEATPGVDYTFTFPGACIITKVALHGKSATLGSVNTRTVGGIAQPTDFVVFVNGVQAGGVLFTLPANTTDVDLVATPNTVVPAGAEVNFAFMAQPAFDTGEILNFILSFAIKGTK